MGARIRRTGIAGLLAVLALAGCAAPGASSQDLLLAAKAHNLEFKSVVASVQAQLHAGDWGSGGAYGAVPADWLGCGPEEYQFSLDRMGPIGVVSPIGAPELARRLRDDGWRAVRVHTYPGISGDVVVTAEHVPASVARLIVTFYEYPRGVSVSAISTCAPGDPWQVLQLMEGSSGRLPEYPETETPSDVPLFESPD